MVKLELANQDKEASNFRIEFQGLLVQSRQPASQKRLALKALLSPMMYLESLCAPVDLVSKIFLEGGYER